MRGIVAEALSVLLALVIIWWLARAVIVVITAAVGLVFMLGVIKAFRWIGWPH